MRGMSPVTRSGGLWHVRAAQASSEMIAALEASAELECSSSEGSQLATPSHIAAVYLSHTESLVRSA